MNKKFVFSTILLLSIIFAFSYTFAANDNSMLQNAANGVRNIVGGAENAVENAARGISNTSKNITGGMQEAGNNVGNAVSNTVNTITADNPDNNNTNNNNTATGFMRNDDTNSGDYTATRTATTTENGTFLGMDSTTWVWLIMGIAALGIGILIYSYFTQPRRLENSDE